MKVLDFGLAKAMEPASAMSSQTFATVTSPAMTQAGVILGTAAYMSPEQARGKPADKRSDVWALGAVLYEMLTGRRAYEGEDVSDTLAGVLRGEPEWSALPAAAPPQLRRVIERCLQRDPRRRTKDIGDVRLDLEEIAAAPVHGSGAPVEARERRRLSLVPWALAVIGLAANAVLVALLVRDSPEAPRVIRLELAMPHVATNTDFGGAEWGPDNTVLFTRSGQLWQASATGGDESQVTKAESGGAVNRWPRMLPGGVAALVATGTGGDGTESSWRIDAVVLASGERQTIMERGTIPHYTPTGHLVFYRDGELLAAPFDAGSRRTTGTTVRVFARSGWGSLGTRRRAVHLQAPRQHHRQDRLSRPDA